MFLCCFPNVKAYNSLPFHLLYTAFPNATPSQGQKHLSLHLLYLPKTCHWSLETALSTSVFNHYLARTSYIEKKKNQLPLSIILKHQLSSGIHDKTALQLHSSSTDFNYLNLSGAVEKIPVCHCTAPTGNLLLKSHFKAMFRESSLDGMNVYSEKGCFLTMSSAASLARLLHLGPLKLLTNVTQ